MKLVYRIVSLILISVMAISLFSCEKDRKYDEGEVLAATRELLLKSIPLNEIYYGVGFDVEDDGASGIYKAATDESLKKYGIKTVEDIKQRTLEVFCDSISETMFKSAFSSISDEDVIVYYSRYYQAYDDDKAPTDIMVNTVYEYFLTGSITYDLESITVLDVEGEVIKLGVSADVESESGKVKTMNLTVRIIEEDDGWRLKSPSYAVYNESTDIYENQNK